MKKNNTRKRNNYNVECNKRKQEKLTDNNGMDHNNFRRPNVHRHSLYDTLSVRVCMCVCEMQLNIWLAYIWNASCEIYFSLMVTLLEHITWYLRRFRCASYLLYSLNSEKINVNRDVSALSVREEECWVWEKKNEKKNSDRYIVITTFNSLKTQ